MMNTKTFRILKIVDVNGAKFDGIHCNFVQFRRNGCLHIISSGESYGELSFY